MKKKHFAKTYRFEHITSSPYCSLSNGKAEAAVHDAKDIIKKSDDIYSPTRLSSEEGEKTSHDEDWLAYKSMRNRVSNSVKKAQ